MGIVTRESGQPELAKWVVASAMVRTINILYVSSKMPTTCINSGARYCDQLKPSLTVRIVTTKVISPTDDSKLPSHHEEVSEIFYRQLSSSASGTVLAEC